MRKERKRYVLSLHALPPDVPLQLPPSSPAQFPLSALVSCSRVGSVQGGLITKKEGKEREREGRCKSKWRCNPQKCAASTHRPRRGCHAHACARMNGSRHELCGRRVPVQRQKRGCCQCARADTLRTAARVLALGPSSAVRVHGGLRDGRTLAVAASWVRGEGRGGRASVGRHNACGRPRCLRRTVRCRGHVWGLMRRREG